MRTLLITLVLLASGTVHAGGMTVVPREDGYCHTRTESYCFEWKLVGDPTVRFIARGDEDVIDYSFFRVGTKGQYKQLVSVHPVLKDNSRPGQLFWAYPWDIADIALAPGKRQPVLLATYEHSLTVTDGEGETISSAHLPAVLFIGRTTQPTATVPPLHFSATPALHLKGTGANNSFKPKPLRGSA